MSSGNNDIPKALCVLIYGEGDLQPRPKIAEEFLNSNPGLAESMPFLNCATGNIDALQRHLAADAQFVASLVGPLQMPPLIAVTHSSLGQLPSYCGQMFEAVRLLLSHGADANTSWTKSHSCHPLSALYGAAGKNHHTGITAILLDAGANPNDNESLYHSLESKDSTCTRLLLEAGATVEKCNALFHALDYDHLETFLMLLAHVKDRNEKIGDCTPLHWAIRRRRSLAHFEALVANGFDASERCYGMPPHVMAAAFGLEDVSHYLQQYSQGSLSALHDFVLACGRDDRSAAEATLREHPQMLAALPAQQMRLLPEIVMAGNANTARLLVELGWPVDAKGGDWNATSLNLAVFRGDADLTGFLLEHGANWSETHGYNDNVHGTLSFASVEQPVPNGDWLACAHALVEHGVPIPSADYHFSVPINEYFAQLRK